MPLLRCQVSRSSIQYLFPHPVPPVLLAGPPEAQACCLCSSFHMNPCAWQLNMEGSLLSSISLVSVLLVPCVCIRRAKTSNGREPWTT